jgi:hypothetical protein
MWGFGRKPPEQDPDPVRNPLAGTKHEEGKRHLFGDSPASREAHRRVMNPPKPPTRREKRQARRAIAPWTQPSSQRTKAPKRSTRAPARKSRQAGSSARKSSSSRGGGILAPGKSPLSSRGGGRSGGKRSGGMPKGKKIR